MKKLFSLSILLAFFSYTFIACNLPKPIPESKMKVIVWNLMKNSYDSTTASFKFTGKFTDEDLAPLEEVFKNNKVSREDFYYSFETIQKDPSKFKILIDSVIAYGSREGNKPDKKIKNPEPKPVKITKG